VIPLLLLGCSEYHFDDGSEKPPKAGAAPAIAASPVALTFPDVHVIDRESATEPISITNVGNAPLELDGVTVEGDAAFTIGALATHSLQPGQTTVLDATFRPTTGSATWAVVTIESSDPGQHDTQIDLYGQGLAPELVIHPLAVDIGMVLPGCEVEHEIELRNVGQDPLTITAASLEDGSSALTWVPLDRATDSFPWIIEPDDELRTRVTYAPSAKGSEVAHLAVTSNDPDQPLTTAEIHGEAGVANVEDVYEQPDLPAADILFVVDDSTSMDDEQAALALYGASLITTLEESATRWHIGVITTTSPTLRGPVITPDTDNPTDEFATQIMPGTGGAHDEKGIEMAYKALHGDAAPGTPFFRDDARLVVIFISDEEEQSDLVDPWDAAAYFQKIKDPRMVLAHSVTALAGDGCTVESYGTRYAELTTMVGGLRIPICGDWSAIVGDLASASVVQLDRFALSSVPLENTIVVRVDGNIATGWVFDEATNEVVFTVEAAVPDAGAEVAISYQVGGCDP
jgi:hypothetical protein